MKAELHIQLLQTKYIPTICNSINTYPPYVILIINNSINLDSLFVLCNLNMECHVIFYEILFIFYNTMYLMWTKFVPLCKTASYSADIA